MTKRTNRLQLVLAGILSALIILMIFLVGIKLLDNRESNVADNPVTEEPVTNEDPVSEQPVDPEEPVVVDNTEVKRAKILANGDILIHPSLYADAYNVETDSFDFNDQYDLVRDFLSSADLTIGNYEGSISNDFELNGYPIFNAPPEIVDAVKNAGYDVVSLANNHILDSHGPGALQTKARFNEAGIDTMGVLESDEDRILIKDVNGIKVALMAYAYGYNGMEATITQDELVTMLTPIDEARIQADIEKAKTMSDVIIVYPHLGVEYMLEPTQEQIDLYHNMVEWGADIVFGNHPHVVQPTETIQRDGLNKFIIYSMGNFISNQRLETVDDIWTERGVVLEVNLVKEGDNPVVIENVVGHPTWVDKVLTDPLEYRFGAMLADFKVLFAGDYLTESGGYDEATLERIRGAYHEVVEHLNITGFESEGQNE